MKEIVLHVGAHKTGSTTIQRSLSHNRRELSDKGLKLFQGSNHGDFYRGFTDCPESFHRYYRNWGKNPDQTRIKNEIKKYFARYPDFIHVVSAEDISLLSEASLRSLFRYLESDCGFSKITAVCFVRDPLDYLNSSIQQYIKPGLTTLTDIMDDSFMNYRLQGCPDFSGGSQNILLQIYLPIPIRLIRAFGFENTRFMQFEKASVSGLVSSLFESVFGNENISWPKDRVFNKSMSHESCILLAHYNDKNPLLSKELNINKNRMHSRLVSILRNIRGRSPALINTSNIDLDLINSKISQINMLLGTTLFTPAEEFPDKYLNNDILTFSPRSINSITNLIGHDKIKSSLRNKHLSKPEIAIVINLLEQKFNSKLRTSIHNLKESLWRRISD